MTGIAVIEDGYLSSPASTPDTSCDERRFLVKGFRYNNLSSKVVERSTKWYDIRNLPLAILAVSVCQWLFHIYSTPTLNKWLRFEPKKGLELWRYFTYMLVHDDWSHLALNIAMQCIFAILLELNQGHFKVLIIYIFGGISGVLGAACLHSDLVIGASAGGYSLLLANVADILLNFEAITYKVYRAIAIATLIFFDIIYDIVHVVSKKEPQISWQAHFFGGLTGIFLGLTLFKCQKPTKVSRTFFTMGLTLYLILFITFIILTVQGGRCSNIQTDHHRSIFLC